MSSIEYDHGTRAGNEGDVVKHSFLLDIIDKLLSQTADATDPFWYIDTHSARPYHRLPSSGSWTRGIGKLRKTNVELPAFLREYAEFCFYEDKPAAMRQTAFAGLGTRLYLGSSALLWQRMRQKAVKRPLWMTLFDIDPEVVAALLAYYADQKRKPSIVGFNDVHENYGDALVEFWNYLGDSRHLVVQGSSYDWFEHLCRPGKYQCPNLVFVDPHKLGADRDGIQRVLERCNNIGSQFLCWTPLMCVEATGVSPDAWSWTHVTDGDEARFIAWCKERDFRLAWFAWGSVGGARIKSYGCQLTFDASYDINRLRERCEQMRSAFHEAGIPRQRDLFRVRTWPE